MVFIPLSDSNPYRYIRWPYAVWAIIALNIAVYLVVNQGSALGGQILLRLLEKRFPGHAHHFFRLGQEAGRGTWRTFQSMLDHQLSQLDQQQTAIAAARAMFGRAQRMLEAVRA